MMWNGKLVWELGADSDTTDYWQRMTVYTGEDTQLPDPTYEAAVANAPAYIGQTTVMFESLHMGTGTTPPQLTFLVAGSGYENIGGTGDCVILLPFDGLPDGSTAYDDLMGGTWTNYATSPFDGAHITSAASRFGTTSLSIDSRDIIKLS